MADIIPILLLGKLRLPEGNKWPTESQVRERNCQDFLASPFPFSHLLYQDGHDFVRKLMYWCLVRWFELLLLEMGLLFSLYIKWNSNSLCSPTVKVNEWMWTLVRSLREWQNEKCCFINDKLGFCYRASWGRFPVFQMWMTQALINLSLLTFCLIQPRTLLEYSPINQMFWNSWLPNRNN